MSAVVGTPFSQELWGERMQCLKLNNCSHWPSPISRAPVLPELMLKRRTNQIPGKGFIQSSCVLISEISTIGVTVRGGKEKHRLRAQEL